MSMWVDLMAASKSVTMLEERLERLTGAEGSCCVPEYQALADGILRSKTFPAALRRVKALADENRLLAVSLLKRRGELCACEIQAATGLSHATVSHHMSTLVDAGMVEARRQGKWLYYRLTRRAESVIP
jgi:DNA-binding transcriptional ArsR family regulator